VCEEEGEKRNGEKGEAEGMGGGEGKPEGKTSHKSVFF